MAVTHFPIKRITDTVVIQNGANEGQGLTFNGYKQVNGLIRGIVIVAPAISGSGYTLTVLDQSGATLFTKTGLTPNAKTFIYTDANNVPLQIPVAISNNVLTQINDTGDSTPTGVLTFDNTGPILANQTVTIGPTTYKFVTSLTGAANEILITADIAAQGTITSNNTNVSDGDTVTIGSVTYRFKTVPVQANDIFIGATADLSLTNLADAINGTGTAGTNWYTGTVASTVVSSSTVASHVLTLTALVAGTSGNSIVLTKSAATLTVNGSGVLGGTTSGAWSGDTTLAHLVSAINASSGAGTTYGTGTVANPDVTAGSVTSHATTLTATSAVTNEASVSTTTTATNLSFGAATLTGGDETSSRTYSVQYLIEG